MHELNCMSKTNKDEKFNFVSSYFVVGCWWTQWAVKLNFLHREQAQIFMTQNPSSVFVLIEVLNQISPLIWSKWNSHLSRLQPASRSSLLTLVCHGPSNKASDKDNFHAFSKAFNMCKIILIDDYVFARKIIRWTLKLAFNLNIVWIRKIEQWMVAKNENPIN